MLRFVGDGDQKKITKNPLHFSMQNSQANTKKNIHKILLESRQTFALLSVAVSGNVKVCEDALAAVLRDCLGGTLSWVRFGIMLGWYGMENGQEQDMGQKMEYQMENSPQLDRAKNGKRMAFRGSFPCFLHFRAIFGPFFAPVHLGVVFHYVFHFFPFPAFGHFPCHTSPA